MVPSFFDVIVNLDSKELAYDNWILQFKLSGKKIHFYGDDTWLRLFPTAFQKSEGTTSFFVADTIEVDKNVTRHLKTELESEDWDVLVLHYLGLDHIGHQGGPNEYYSSPFHRFSIHRGLQHCFFSSFHFPALK